MKTKFKILLCLLLALGLAACADGVLPETRDKNIIVPLAITKFAISKAEAPPAGGAEVPSNDGTELQPAEGAAKVMVTLAKGEQPAIQQPVDSKPKPEASVSSKVEISAGDYVKLEWEIIGLESVTIQASSKDVELPAIDITDTERETEVNGVKTKVTTKQAVGSGVVGPITEDTTFLLSAVGKTEIGDPSTKQAKAEAVITKELSIAKFEASPSEIKAGESAELCFEVTPEEAEVVIKDDQGSEIPLTANCVTVTPIKTTSYILTVTLGENSTTATATVTVAAAAELRIVAFSVTPDKIFGPTDVKLAWEVEPADAKVSIDQGVGEVPASGEKAVNISQTTIFTLTATLGDKTRQEARTVVLEIAGAGLVVGLQASATEVFEGEEVTFTWTGTLPSGAIATLVGPAGIQELGGATQVAVAPKASGSYVVNLSRDGAVVAQSVPVNVTVRTWKSNETGTWSAVGGNSQVALAGAAENKADEITFVRILGDGSKELIQFNLANTFKDLYLKSYITAWFTGADGHAQPYGEFPVNAITLDGERIYAGLVGGILLSDDGGKTWSAVDIFPVFKGQPAKHPSCKGTEQTGDESNEATIHSLQQICDLAVDEGRLIAATDHGVYYLDGVDEHVKDRNNTQYCWQGIQNGPKCSKANELSGTVVHALLRVDDRIYAATAKGVWVSYDRAQSWQAYNDGELGEATAIYAMAADAEGDDLLYVGGPDGLYVRAPHMADPPSGWMRVGFDAGTVYSLGVSSDAIFAGTDSGVFISRDGGGKWVDISASMGSAAKVNSIAVATRGVTSNIYLATGNGVFSSAMTNTEHKTVLMQEGQPPTESGGEEAGKTAAETLTRALRTILW